MSFGQKWFLPSRVADAALPWHGALCYGLDSASSIQEYTEISLGSYERARTVIILTC